MAAGITPSERRRRTSPAFAWAVGFLPLYLPSAFAFPLAFQHHFPPTTVSIMRPVALELRDGASKLVTLNSLSRDSPDDTTRALRPRLPP